MKYIQFQGQNYQLTNRDSQRSKVYKAEHAHRMLFPDCWKPLPGADDNITVVQQFVDMVTSLPVWKQIHDEVGLVAPSVSVHPTHGSRGSGGFGFIRLSKGLPRSPCYILHELAHSMPGVHHWPFCRAYLTLVRAVLGTRIGDGLRDCFRDKRVKYRKPRFVSDEERQRLRERGKALAAGKTNDWVDFVNWKAA
jgi:hypothetical protein